MYYIELSTLCIIQFDVVQPQCQTGLACAGLMILVSCPLFLRNQMQSIEFDSIDMIDLTIATSNLQLWGFPLEHFFVSNLPEVAVPLC